jgi:hypothetical protein
MQTQCSNCGTDYAALQRANKLDIYTCSNCDQEYCEECIEHKEIGQFIWLVRCPKCSEDELGHSKLTDRFTIFADPQTVDSSLHAIVLPYVVRDIYPLRTEALVKKALPKLKEFHPDFLLLDEDDPAIRKLLASWFPQQFNEETAVGAGALIWIQSGEPLAILPGGPHLTEYEILKTSRSMWT